MAFLNPFANLGIRTPSIATPGIAYPSILAPYLGSSATPGQVNGPVAPSAPMSDAAYRQSLGITTNFGKSNVPITSWYTNPSDYVRSLQSMNDQIRAQPGIQIGAFNPNGYKAPGNQFSWGNNTPMPPAPTMQKLTAPVPAPAAKVTAPAAKTAVSAPKTK